MTTRNTSALLSLLLLMLSSLSINAQNGLIGWATYNDYEVGGTIGGGLGTIVRANNRTDLESYAKASSPYIIILEGEITGSGTIKITSNKSIIGAGDGATLNGIGIDVNGASNIIIRNLTIKNAKPDALAFGNSHHVWIDHCDLSDSDDGLLDYTIGSSYLTVSWTKFHHHDKASICNSGTQHFEDVGKNRVTYHHNWFYNNVQRNPRVGYGMGHIFNNYYSDISSYCIGYHTGASVLVERNYFYKSKTPLNQMYSSDPTVASYADAKEVENIFDATSGNTKGTGRSFDPETYYDYRFALNQAAEIPQLIQNFAGPIAGIESEYTPLPNDGAIDYYQQNPTLRWSIIEDVQSWVVYFGESSSEMIMFNTDTNQYEPPTLKAGTKYFWKVDAVCADKIIEGHTWCFSTAQSIASKPYPSNGEQNAHLREAKNETTTQPLTLKWTKALGGTKYNVYWSDQPNLTEEHYKGETEVNNFITEGLKYGHKYYWRVNTIDEEGKETEGEVWSFTSDIVYANGGRTEAENMVLNVRSFLETQDGSWFKVSNNKVVAGEAGPGTMSCVWAGNEVKCDITIGYFDESDGKGGCHFFVNDEKIKSWLAAANNDKIVTYTMKDVHLHKDDQLRLDLYVNAGEMNRTDYMDIAVTETIGTSINNSIAEKQIEIYPTTFDTELFVDIQLDKPTSLMIRMISISGQEIFKQTYLSMEGNNTISIASTTELMPQVYIVEIVDLDGNRLAAKRVVKQ